jgi:hypothetical protein
MTQNEQVIEYVRKHWFITRRDAAVKLSIMNLWCRISEIEDALKVRFDRRYVTSKRGKRVLQYWAPAKLSKRAA